MHKVLICILMSLISYTSNLSGANLTDFKAGDVIIWSSGTTNPIPSSYRVIKPGQTMFSEAIKRYPEKLDDFSPDRTLYINCYPAFIPFPKAAVYTDTYLDIEKTFASLKLAYENDMTVVLLAQPLFALEVLLRYQKAGYKFPKRLILTIGGYPIPSTLLKILIDICNNNNCAMTWLAGYGLAEIDAGLFVGMETNEAGEILYYPRSDVQVEICDVDNSGFGNMRISKDNGPQDQLIKDKAQKVGDAYIIRVEERKLNYKAFQEFENWTNDIWERRTGYFHYDVAKGSIMFQLREGKYPENRDELTFYSFIEKVGGSSNWWGKKPNWR